MTMDRRGFLAALAAAITVPTPAGRPAVQETARTVGTGSLEGAYFYTVTYLTKDGTETLPGRVVMTSIPEGPTPPVRTVVYEKRPGDWFYRLLRTVDREAAR